jgi:hypothetical protein
MWSNEGVERARIPGWYAVGAQVKVELARVYLPLGSLVDLKILDELRRYGCLGGGGDRLGFCRES